ncbi:MAG: GLPGLI family protein [Bacteroidetes bacterium]|nr:GLPGLI family protein [Bacteroidota bacterium]
MSNRINKIFICIIANFVLANNAFAVSDKYTTLDSAKIVVSYNLTFQVDSNDISSIRTEEMLLLIGNDISLFISYNQFKNHHGESAAIISFSNTYNLFEGKGISASFFPYRIFKNFPAGKITFCQFIPFSYYKYIEDMNSINWQILEKKERILGYDVYKAITKYGGRTWEAWFTPYIPIIDGPYKFHGLPGLIVKLQDSKNHYVFVINNFGKQPEAIPIKMLNEKYIDTNRHKFHEFEKHFTRNQYEHIYNLGTRPDDPTPFIEASKRENIFLELKPE